MGRPRNVSAAPAAVKSTSCSPTRPRTWYAARIWWKSSAFPMLARSMRLTTRSSTPRVIVRSSARLRARTTIRSGPADPAPSRSSIVTRVA